MIFITALLTVLSSSTVVILFLLSEEKLHRNNYFIRRYASHPITKLYDLPIKYNSYYISGFDEERLYLGNTTAPLHVLEINLETRDTFHINLELEASTVRYQLPKVKIQASYFFVLDGNVPVILRGKIKDWKASFWMLNEAYFNNAIPVDSNTIYIRTLNSNTKESTLGFIHKSDTTVGVQLNSTLLEKQFDGVFDVDGTMMVSNASGIVGFSYFYRNQFMLIDSGFQLIQRQNTLDTITVAKIGFALNNKSKVTKMNKPPQMVNNFSTIFNDYVLISSDRLGRFEVSEMLEEASIVDVYDWRQKSYDFSFYLYKIGNDKAREFQLNDQYLVALIGDKLSVYQLSEQLLNKKKLL